VSGRRHSRDLQRSSRRGMVPSKAERLKWTRRW
jgi:hypothetical protein